MVEEFEVTHVIPETPHENPHCLTQIGFYTKRNSGGFQRFFGRDSEEKVSNEEARQEQLRGEIMSISPTKINRENQHLWFGSHLVVYIADSIGKRLENKREIGRIPRLKVTHIFPEAPEKYSLCPIGYYCTREDIEEIFFKGMGRGLNNLEGLTRDAIDRQEKTGEVLRLNQPAILPLTTDLFLSPEGKIYFGTSHINTYYGMSVAKEKPNIEIDSSKIPRRDFSTVIKGSSHYSTQGDMGKEGWNYALLIKSKKDAVKIGKIIGREEGVAFSDELKKYLPENHHLRLIPPVHIPGDTWEFSIPLEKTTDSNAVGKILERYFPREISN